jgi:hypothetical protein
MIGGYTKVTMPNTLLRLKCLMLLNGGGFEVSHYLLVCYPKIQIHNVVRITNPMTKSAS